MGLSYSPGFAGRCPPSGWPQATQTLTSSAVIDESIVFGNINEDGIELVDSKDSSVDSKKRPSPLDIAKQMAPEDPVGRQQIANGYIFNGVDEMSGKVPLPDNAVLDLAEQYLKAGGDYAGVVIGVVWVFGIAPDAPDEDQEKLKKIGQIGENEKIGKMVFDGKAEWLKTLMKYTSPFRLSEKLIVDWKDQRLYNSNKLE